MIVNDTRTVLRIGALLARAAAAFYALMALGIAYPDLGVQRVIFAIAGAAYVLLSLLFGPYGDREPDVRRARDSGRRE